MVACLVVLSRLASLYSSNEIREVAYEVDLLPTTTVNALVYGILYYLVVREYELLI